jgi:hypothetical protein
MHLALFILEGNDALIKGVTFSALSHLPAEIGLGQERRGAGQQRERERDEAKISYRKMI